MELRQKTPASYTSGCCAKPAQRATGTVRRDERTEKAVAVYRNSWSLCECHCRGDDGSDLPRRFGKVYIGKVGVARRGPVPPMTEQLADQGQVLAGHDGLTGRGVPQVMQPKPAELRVRADRAPARCEAKRAPAFGVTRAHERIGIARTGERGDVRPRGLAERHRAGTGLGVLKNQRVSADVPPAQIEHLAPAAAVEREQANCGDGFGAARFVIPEGAPEPRQLVQIEKPADALPRILDDAETGVAVASSPWRT